MLLPFRGVKRQQEFEKLCGQLAGFDTGKHQIIVPNIAQSHHSVIDIMTDNNNLNYITKVLHFDSLVWPKTRSLTMKHIPAQVKEFIHNFVRVINKFVHKMKNCSCDITKVLKNVVQISCPLQQNGIDCGLFAVIICLHIFDGAEVGPHIFTQHQITQLRAQLPSLLTKDRDERCYGIWSQFRYLSASLSSLLPPHIIIPRSPKGGIELPQTIKLIAGGSVHGIISFKVTWIYKKPLYGNLFDSSSSESDDNRGMKPVMVPNLRTDDPVPAQHSGTNSDSDGSSDAIEVAKMPSKTCSSKTINGKFINRKQC